MALTLITNPENVHFARNPCVVNIRADQDGGGTLYDAVGVKAELEYVVTDRFEEFETLNVEYDEPDGTTTVVTLTARPTYTGFDNRIPDDTFAGTDAEYWALILEKVSQHPHLVPFFDVGVTAGSPNKLNIVARELGWTLDVTNDAGLTVNAVAEVASSLPPNYKVRLEVFFENTYGEGDYVQSAQLEGTPEAGTGYVYFDLSGVLSAECRAAREVPLVPVFGTNTPFLGDNFRRWYFRYTEESGEPVEAENWTYTDPKIAYDGGVSQALFAAGDFLGNMDDENALLTWMPDGKKLAVEQPEYLTWYNHTNATRTVYLRVIWYDITDGSASSATDYFTPGLSVAAGESAVFPVWPAMFGLDTETDAYKYTVQVGYTALAFSALSQARTYYIDRDFYESERNLMYLDGFGTPETWRCTGDYGKRLNVERLTAERPLLPGYEPLASDRYQYDRRWDNEIIYRTGYLTRTEADALQEMLLAGELYDVSEAGYIPLQIISNEFRVTDTRQELHAYEFSAIPRLSAKNYSRQALTTTGSDAWLDENGEPWWDQFTLPWEE